MQPRTDTELRELIRSHEMEFEPQSELALGIARWLKHEHPDEFTDVDEHYLANLVASIYSNRE